MLILVDIDGKWLSTLVPGSPNVLPRKHWSEPRREPKRPRSGFIGLHNHYPGDVGVYVYDPRSNSWSNEPLAMPDRLGRNRQAKNGFFDPELGSLFLHSAGDSDDNGTIWVYRYKELK